MVRTFPSFRPLSGSFFLSLTTNLHIANMRAVSVPYRGLSFYLNHKGYKRNNKKKFPSPIGVFLFIYSGGGDRVKEVMFPSPIGVFLFIWLYYVYIFILSSVSVPYRGLSFYLKIFSMFYTLFSSFRPLSGSFFLSPVLCIPLFAIPESMTCGVKYPTLIRLLISHTTSLSTIEIPTSA